MKFIAALLVSGASVIGVAQAADAPNMLGNWNPTGETASARIGLPVSGWTSGSAPAYNLQPRPRVVVDSQQGRGLGGYEVFADGTKEPFVGVLSRNGQHILVSTDRGNAYVDLLSSDSMEWCWMDNLDHVAVVSCDVMAREPAK